MKLINNLLSLGMLSVGILALPAADYEEKTLASFDSGAEGWTAVSGASGEHSKKHGGSFKITLGKQGSAFQKVGKMDFTGWDKLKMDVHNASDKSVLLTLKGTDVKDQHYTCWYFRVFPGENTIEYNLRGFSTKVPKKGEVKSLDLSNIKIINVRNENKVEGSVLYFDNVRLSRGPEPFIKPKQAATSGKPATEIPGNLVTNANFELGLQNWGTWGKWDGGLYNFNSGAGKDAYNGQFSGAIECERVGRGGMNQIIKLPKAGKYSVSFAVKGSTAKANSMRILITPAEKGKPELDALKLTKNFEVSTKWTTKSFEWDGLPGQMRFYLMHTSDDNIYFDNVSFVPQGQKIAAGTTKKVKEKPSKVVVKGDRTTVNGKQFFPIGIYGVEDPTVDFKGTGMNFAIGNAVGSTSDEWMTKCREAGVMTIANMTGMLRAHLGSQSASVAEAVKDRAAFFGYYLCDEPDHSRWYVSPGELRQSTEILKRADSNHPSIVLVMGWDRSMVFQYSDCASILACDPYSVEDMDKPVRIARCMEDASKDKRHQPIWSVLQLGWDNTTSDYPLEVLQCQAYASIACGADALLWFELQWAKRHPQHWEAFKKLTLELKDIHDELCGDEPAQMQPQFSDPRVIGITKQTKDGLLLITVNKTLEDVGEVTVTIPGLKKKSATGLFGSKNASFSNNAFKVTFNKGGRHIYRIKLLLQND